MKIKSPKYSIISILKKMNLTSDVAENFTFYEDDNKLEHALQISMAACH